MCLTQSRLTNFLTIFQTVWACNLCRKKQDLLAKTGQWYHGGQAKPVQLPVDIETPSGSETTSTKTDITPPTEKRPIIFEKTGEGGAGSEKENFDRHGRPMNRAGSLQGRELKRQFSLDAPKPNQGKDGNQSDRSEMSDRDKLRERGQLPPGDRGRNRDRSPASRRNQSEPRMSETDKRYNQERRHPDRDPRYGDGQHGHVRDRQSRERMDHADKGKYPDNDKRRKDGHMDRLIDGHRDISKDRLRLVLNCILQFYANNTNMLCKIVFLIC